MLPLLRTVQAVDDENVVESSPVQRPNKRATYETGAPGNDDSVRG